MSVTFLYASKQSSKRIYRNLLVIFWCIYSIKLYLLLWRSEVQHDLKVCDVMTTSSSAYNMLCTEIIYNTLYCLLNNEIKQWNTCLKYTYFCETLISFSWCFIFPRKKLFVIKRTSPCFIVSWLFFLFSVVVLQKKTLLIFPKERCFHCRDNHSCGSYLFSRICHAREQHTDNFGIQQGWQIGFI